MRRVWPCCLRYKVYYALLSICFNKLVRFIGGCRPVGSSISSAHASQHARGCRAQVQLAAAAGSAVLGLAAAGVGLAGLAGPAELLSPTSALTLCVVCAAAGTAAPSSASRPGLELQPRGCMLISESPPSGLWHA